MRLNIFRKAGITMSKSNEPNKNNLGSIKVPIVCLVCGLVMGSKIIPSVYKSISSLKLSSNTKVVVDISSSNNNVSETTVITTVPETTTEETTTTTLVTTTEEVTTTTTVTTSYKVHILVTGKCNDYTIYDVVYLQTFEDDVEIIGLGYNEYHTYHTHGKTKYYRFKTSTGEVITATQDSCYLVVEE